MRSKFKGHEISIDIAAFRLALPIGGLLVGLFVSAYMPVRPNTDTLTVRACLPLWKVAYRPASAIRSSPNGSGGTLVTKATDRRLTNDMEDRRIGELLMSPSSRELATARCICLHCVVPVPVRVQLVPLGPQNQSDWTAIGGQLWAERQK